MDKQKTASLILRVGLAFGFVYAAVSAYFAPQNWVGFLPVFFRSSLMLNALGVVEILLGIWLLWGKKVFYSAILSAIMMVGIIIFNLGALDIVFRDIVILLAAIALALLNWEK